MPMSFPDYDSLRRRAILWKFRTPNEGESEQDFRAALADFVDPHDLVESMEIRSSVGWDQFANFAKCNNSTTSHAIDALDSWVNQ
jgi:hypothetical protein